MTTKTLIGPRGSQIIITVPDTQTPDPDAKIVIPTQRPERKPDPHCESCSCHRTATQTPTPKTKSKKPQIGCLCGCGEVTNPGRKFRTGHDARHKRDMAKAEAGVTDYSFLTPSIAAGLRTLIANGQGDEVIGGVTGHTITDILAMAENQS